MLKGGVLLAAFDLRRPTRDIDFLALAVDNEPAAVARLVAEVSEVELEVASTASLNRRLGTQRAPRMFSEYGIGLPKKSVSS